MGVVVGLGRGANISDHDGPTVPPQRVFQQAGQLAVPVWDVSVLILEEVKTKQKLVKSNH